MKLEPRWCTHLIIHDGICDIHYQECPKNILEMSVDYQPAGFDTHKKYRLPAPHISVNDMGGTRHKYMSTHRREEGWH